MILELNDQVLGFRAVKSMLFNSADKCGDDVTSGKKDISIDMRKFGDTLCSIKNKTKQNNLEVLCTEDCKRKFEEILSAKM